MKARDVIALRFVRYTKYDLLGKSGNELADMVLDALDAARFVIVPKEPTPEMLADVLPLRPLSVNRDTNLLAERALFILEQRKLPADRHADGMTAAVTLIQDYRAMLKAAIGE